MRIQHNILSMNAYRNYTNNTSALGKNLEKLSSGYKINRAGDDAAGLAISEKMRAQIKGLEAAQKNVKDGISFVKTAEGAMQEIQDMMSRMKYLATQSANGTYEDAVDRNALQDEVDSLLSEINRIADSANFNDIHMLNGGAGSTGGAAGVGGSSTSTSVSVSDNMTKGGNPLLKDVDAKTQKNEATLTKGASASKQGSVSITFTGEDGTTNTINVTFKGNGTANGKITYSIDGGAEKTAEATNGTANEVSATEAGKLLTEILKDTKLGESFDITEATGKLTFTAKTEGATKAEIIAIKEDNDTSDTTAAATLTISEATKGADAYQQLKFDAGTFGQGNSNKIWTSATIASTDAAKLTDKAEDAIITIGGEKFAFINAGEDEDKAKAALGNDVTLVEVATDKTMAAADVDKFVDKVNTKLGYKAVELDSSDNTNLTVKINATADGGTGGAGGAGGAGGKGGFNITLQIGDTSDDFNKLKMTIGSMKTTALGVDGLKINTIDTAAAAIQTIKTAINTVSTVRGNLGAYQNRLEHTQNNLSVMTENIQDAESTIRDTDVADEMMAYTKNNILIQSAQAMLAQANAVPQGVLQLLQ